MEKIFANISPFSIEVITCLTGVLGGTAMVEEMILWNLSSKTMVALWFWILMIKFALIVV